MPGTDNNLVTKAQSLIKGLNILWQNYKATYTVIIVVLVLAVIFGGWRIVYFIKSPFIREPVAENALKTGVSDELQAIAQLRSKDTDSDGLTDYDELYVYGTSPYLEDTDSDGYLDKTEIDTGNNPNCPAGEKCLATVDEVNQGVVNPLPVQSLAPGSNPLDVSDDQLRQLLLDSGADPVVLSQVDDATLRQMYNQVIADIQLQQAGGEGSAASINANSEVTKKQTLQQLQNLSADEIRQLLLQAGVKEEDLQGVNDEDLVSFYQEILAQELSQ